MGGRGKTQIALRYCRNAFQNRTFNTVLWIDASSEISAHQAIESILSKAEIPTSAAGSGSNVLAFKNALISLNGPCLLVFDNYDTPKTFPKIADMFIQHEQLCILFTSRDHESLRLGMPIHLEDMDQSDAENLLLISSGLIRQDVNPQNLAHTVNMLGCLPLALDQAGAYIRKLHLSLGVFEKHYLDRQKKILQYTPDLFEYRKSLLPGSEPSVLSVFTTWELSLEQLGDDRPHFEHLLTLSAFFDHNRVHEALFSTRCTLNFTACSGVQDDWLQCMLTNSAWDSYRFQNIIANLHGLSLLQKFWIEDGHIVFSLHHLVNDWLRTRIREKKRASMVVEAAVTVAGTDGGLSLIRHLRKCSQGLSDCARTLFHDCVDKNSPRTIADVAPVPKLVADEMDPELQCTRAEASCCPHGRPCGKKTSIVKLEWIVSCRRAGVMTSEIRTRYSWLRRIVLVAVSLTTLSSRPFCNEIEPIFQYIRRLLENYKDQISENDKSSLQIDTLNQELLALFESIDVWSGGHMDFKEVDFKAKQVEKIIDGIFHTILETPSKTQSHSGSAILPELADWIGILKLSSASSQGRDMALIRNELRSLRFLHSGS